MADNAIRLRRRLDQTLAALGDMLILIRIARLQGMKFHPHHNELFERAEAVIEDEIKLPR